jgi:hypothetical protein
MKFKKTIVTISAFVILAFLGYQLTEAGVSEEKQNAPDKVFETDVSMEDKSVEGKDVKRVQKSIKEDFTSIEKAKSRLPDTFKEKIKMPVPTKLPFQTKKEPRAQTSKIADLWIYTQYWYPREERGRFYIEVLSHTVPEENDHPESFISKNKTLNGVTVEYLDSGDSQKLHWVGPKTGLDYLIVANKKVGDGAEKYTIDELIKIYKSIS